MAKKKNKISAPEERWIVEKDITKGALSGQRGMAITVKDLKTGKSLKKSTTAATKNKLYIAGAKLVEELKQELKKN